MEETLKQFIDDYFTCFGEETKIKDDDITDKYAIYLPLTSLIMRVKLDPVMLKEDEDDKKRMSIVQNTWFNAILQISQCCSYEVTLKHAENINKVLEENKKKQKQ